jgi:hypothetical protein
LQTANPHPKSTTSKSTKIKIKTKINHFGDLLHHPKPKTHYHAEIGKPKTHHHAKSANPRPTTKPRSASPSQRDMENRGEGESREGKKKKLK